MLKTVLVITTALAVASPALAKGSKKAEAAPAGWENAAPIPYSELAAADAKINGSGGGEKKASKKKAKAEAAAPAPDAKAN